MLSATCPTNRATGKYSNHGRTLNIHFYRRDQQQIYSYCFVHQFPSRDLRHPIPPSVSDGRRDLKQSGGQHQGKQQFKLNF